MKNKKRRGKKQEPRYILAECLGVVDHLVHHLPALVVVGRGDDKLLHLLELVHAEDAPRVAPVRAHLNNISRCQKHCAVDPYPHIFLGSATQK